MRVRWLPILDLVVALPATVSADIVGARAYSLGGVQQASRGSQWAIGAGGALQILGFEAFADLRFLEGQVALQPRGAWNRFGLRYTLSLGLPLAFFGEVAYIADWAPEDTVDGSAGNQRPLYSGFGATAGARVDWDIFWEFFLGLQVEAGVHSLSGGDDVTGLNSAGMVLFGLDV